MYSGKNLSAFWRIHLPPSSCFHPEDGDSTFSRNTLEHSKKLQVVTSETKIFSLNTAVKATNFPYVSGHAFKSSRQTRKSITSCKYLQRYSHMRYKRERERQRESEMKTSGVSDKKISRHETPTDITRSDNIFHSLGSLLCPLNCWDVLRVTKRNKITQSVPLHNTVPSYSMMAVRHSKQVILTTGTQCQRPQQNCFLFHNFTTVDTLPH